MLGDQVEKAYLLRATPYVKRPLVKSIKISDQALYMMMMSILKSYLTPHQNKIQGFSDVLKLKIMWHGTIIFRFVKDRKCESSSGMRRVICACKGIVLTLDFTKKNHTHFHTFGNLLLFYENDQKYFCA